jgi:hypothetical protein
MRSERSVQTRSKASGNDRSRLNRTALNRCCRILEELLPVILQLVIEHRADDNWPPLCYPPIMEA